MRRVGESCLIFLLTIFCAFSSFAGRGGRLTQFDVWCGYEGVVPEAGWFPIVCEIKNDGAGFIGYIEVSAGNYGPNQSVRVNLELPTGTLKRVSIPVFCASMYNSRWDVRLCTDRGRIIEEKTGVGPGLNKQVPTDTVIIGSLARTLAGSPTVRQITRQDRLLQPMVSRFTTAAIVPDNPLLLEAMDVFYLNSEHAPDLNVNQYNALLAWVNNGGHLIVGVESATDVNGTPWLRSIFPCDVAPGHPVTNHTGLQEWIRRDTSSSTRMTPARTRIVSTGMGNPYISLAEDPDFEKAEMEVAVATARTGDIVAGTTETPLIISAHAGRGRITALLFSPEREPFHSWKHFGWFWSKIADVPNDLYMASNPYPRPTYSLDGVFGAMIDSKQIRKLPVEWLLLLLIVYLVVIGPMDQYWLKKIKRPMLTWITFPCYVVAFSLMIYFIGYKLRAGETEWNELHFVDVLHKGEGAELRGRTYASVYSPVNATYKVSGEEQFSTFRGEFQGSYGANQNDDRAEITQAGNNFNANIFVPVWTSQLYMSDWWDSGALPVDMTVTPTSQGWTVVVNNLRDRPLSNVHVAIAGRISELGTLQAGEKKTFTINRNQGQPVGSFVSRFANNFQTASTSRRQAFGGTGSGRISDLPNSSIALTFIAQSDQWNFIVPPGLDLSQLVDQGEAVLLAWETDYSPTAKKPMNKFPTRRSHKDTLWRLAVPIGSSSTP